MNIPLFHRYRLDSQYCSAVDRSGFSTNDWMANAAPSADSICVPISMYPYPVSGPVGGTPKVTTSPSDANAIPTLNASRNRWGSVIRWSE